MTLIDVILGEPMKKCSCHDDSEIKPHQCYRDFSLNDEDYMVGDFLAFENKKQEQVGKLLCMFMTKDGTFNIMLEINQDALNYKSLLTTSLSNILYKCSASSSELRVFYDGCNTKSDNKVLSELNSNSPCTTLKSPHSLTQTPALNSTPINLNDGDKEIVLLDDNRNITTPRRNSVKRNLNKSFGDVHDYSIINPAAENSLKVRLRKSKRLVENDQLSKFRKSTRNIPRKSYADYISPQKPRKLSVNEICSPNFSERTPKAIRRLDTQTHTPKNNKITTSFQMNSRKQVNTMKESLDETPRALRTKRTISYCESGSEDETPSCAKLGNHLNESLRTATLKVNVDKLSLKDRNTQDVCNDTEFRIRIASENTSFNTPRRRRTRQPSASENQHALYTPSSRPQRITKQATKISPMKTSNTPLKSSSINKAKLIREGAITPSMQQRSNAVEGDSTPLMKARNQLHVSYVPKSLPCREKEYADVFRFLHGKLLDGIGGCMYVSGVPGTGKTATVTSVINSLQQDKSVPKFTFVNINGMRLTEPRQCYVEIVKQLNGKTVPWEQAQTILEDIFVKSKKQKLVVMLIDELDILCTKRQDVVYNLLDWPTKANNQLIVITIANTMDLPERLLMSRVTSRLGLTRLTFQAYTYKQLQEIVMMRLCDTNTFNSDAVQYVARKVASVSGDARRALDICRRAAEIAEAEGKFKLVNMTHVNETLNLMITQPKVQAIRHCSLLEQLILQSIVSEIERTGVEETNFRDVYKMLVSHAAIEGFQMISITIALAAVTKLGACRLILTDPRCNNVHQRIVLNVSADDVFYALRNS